MASTRIGRFCGAGLAALVLLVLLAGDFAPGALAQSIFMTVDNSAMDGAVHLKVTANALAAAFETDIPGGQRTGNILETNYPSLRDAKLEFKLSGNAPPGAGVYRISLKYQLTPPVGGMEVVILGGCQDGSQSGLRVKITVAWSGGGDSKSYCASRQSSGISKGPWDVLGSGIAG